MSSHLKQLVKMEEVRIDGIKMDFPQRMTGEESENTRAQMFYAATSKLMAAKKKISARARIKKLAEYCNLSYLGDLESESLTDLYQCQLMDPTKWKIVAFLDSTGRRLTNSTLATDHQVLKPVGDAATNLAANARRENNIKYVHIETTIDLSDLTKNEKSKYEVTSIIALPMSDKTVKDGHGTDIVAHTFLGNDDLRTYDAPDFQREIILETRQLGAATLKLPGLGMTNAVFDEETEDEAIKERILEGEFNYLRDKIFETSCPGSAYRPESILDDVTQIVRDGDNEIRIPMAIYAANVIKCMECIGAVDAGKYPVNVVTHFTDNMDPAVKTDMETQYRGHLGEIDRGPKAQMDAIREVLKHAAASEKRVLQLRKEVRDQAVSVMSAVPGYTAITGKSRATATTNASQAETTILNNTPLPRYIWDTVGKCICCGGDHNYMSRRGVIGCPHANRPGAKENVEANRPRIRALRESNPEQFDQMVRNSRQRNGGGRDRRGGGYRKPNFKKMSNDAKTHLIKSILDDDEARKDFNRMSKRANEGDEDEDKPPARRSKREDLEPLLLTAIVAFTNDASTAPPIPVKIDSLLAHMALEVGEPRPDKQPISLVGLVDSGAGCPIGYQPYFEGVALIDPTIMVATYSCSGGEYTPITMNGIVDDAGGAPTSTQLPVAMELRTPYRGMDGRPIHLMVALGMHVSVNFVLPSGWLKATGAVLDYRKKEIRLPFYTEDSDVTTFPMIFQRPRKSVPPTTLGTSRHQAAFSVLPKIDGLLHIMKKYNPNSIWMGYACDFAQYLRSFPWATAKTMTL